MTYEQILRYIISLGDLTKPLQCCCENTDSKSSDAGRVTMFEAGGWAYHRIDMDHFYQYFGDGQVIAQDIARVCLNRISRNELLYFKHQDNLYIIDESQTVRSLDEHILYVKFATTCADLIEELNQQALLQAIRDVSGENAQEDDERSYYPPSVRG